MPEPRPGGEEGGVWGLGRVQPSSPGLQLPCFMYYSSFEVSSRRNLPGDVSSA